VQCGEDRHHLRCLVVLDPGHAVLLVVRCGYCVVVCCSRASRAARSLAAVASPWESGSGLPPPGPPRGGSDPFSHRSWLSHVVAFGMKFSGGRFGSAAYASTAAWSTSTSTRGAFFDVPLVARCHDPNAAFFPEVSLWRFGHTAHHASKASG